MSEDRELVLGDIRAAAGVGAIISLATGGHMGAGGGARRNNGGGAAGGERLIEL